MALFSLFWWERLQERPWHPHALVFVFESATGHLWKKGVGARERESEEGGEVTVPAIQEVAAPLHPLVRRLLQWARASRFLTHRRALRDRRGRARSSGALSEGGRSCSLQTRPPGPAQLTSGEFPAVGRPVSRQLFSAHPSPVPTQGRGHHHAQNAMTTNGSRYCPMPLGAKSPRLRPIRCSPQLRPRMVSSWLVPVACPRGW